MKDCRKMTEEQRALVEKNLGVAYKVAERFYGAARCREDQEAILSSAMLGLCSASLGFRVDNGVKFSTFCGVCCKQQIEHDLATNGLIWIPRYLSRRASLDRPGRSAATIARKARSWTQLGDPSVRLFAAESTVPAAEWSEIRDALGTLDPDHQTAIKMTADGAGIDRIGCELGVSRESARKIRRQGQRRMRELFGEAG